MASSMARSCASPSHALGSSGRAKARPAAFASRNPRGIARGRHVGLETAVSAIDQRGTLNPDLSYDEEFCIIDKGCGNVLRRLTASPEDVAQLDALLREVNFDANVNEWLQLLTSSEDLVTSSSDDDSSEPGGVTGAHGVFDENDELVGFGSTVVYGADSSTSPFGWVGNIVVRSDYRKRGVASMVLRAALESMGPNTVAVLDASDMGQPLYLKAGFRPVASVRRWTLSREDVEDQKAGTVSDDVDASASTADWDGGDGALITAMDAAVFGASRGNMLRAWRDTAPELCVVEDGVGYAIAHVRGCKLYLGPIGLDVRPGNTYESIRTRTFMERYLTRVTRHLASNESLDGVVVYVPEGLDPMDGVEDLEGLLEGPTSSTDGALATDQSGQQLRGVSSLRSSLGRRGFDAEERTTRMVMLPGTMDECIGDWCSSDEDDDDEFVTPLKTPVAVEGMGVPGFNMGALTIASLDLG